MDTKTPPQKVETTGTAGPVKRNLSYEKILIAKKSSVFSEASSPAIKVEPDEMQESSGSGDLQENVIEGKGLLCVWSRSVISK